MSENTSSSFNDFLDEPEFQKAMESLRRSYESETATAAKAHNIKVSKTPLKLALERLSVEDPVAGKVFQLHRIVGHSIDEVAEMLDVPPLAISDKWKYAKAWLQVEVQRITASR